MVKRRLAPDNLECASRNERLRPERLPSCKGLGDLVPGQPDCRGTALLNNGTATVSYCVTPVLQLGDAIRRCGNRTCNHYDRQRHLIKSAASAPSCSGRQNTGTR
jgi:hypothetical protein